MKPTNNYKKRAEKEAQMLLDAKHMISEKFLSVYGNDKAGFYHNRKDVYLHSDEFKIMAERINARRNKFKKWAGLTA